ncbi:outer membrane protein assembly factor BamB [Candidatus Magnetomoraceae bacterium gMMP-13]
MKKLFIISILFLFIAFNPGLASAEISWPMRGHDAKHTGQSEYAEKSYGLLKWRFQTDNSITSSPVIGPDNTLYTGSTDFYLYAINPDGSLKWKYKTGYSIYSSPAIGTDGTVYAGSYDNYLYAFNPDGTLKWRYATNDNIAAAPVIGDDGTIYVGSKDDYLYALNPDGTLKWKYNVDDKISVSGPAISDDGIIYVGDMNASLYALNPDGTLKWKYETSGDYMFSPPAIAQDGTVYVGSKSDSLYALNPDGTLKWKYAVSCASVSISADGTLYAGAFDNYLYALNPDGTLKWRYSTGDSIYSSPAIDKNGTIFFGSRDDYFYVLKPDGRLSWKYKTEGYIHSSPAIGADGAIYIGSGDNYIYAFHIDNKGVLIGKITDKDSNQPIAATVSVDDEHTADTDSNGEYFLLLDSGNYNITFTSELYQTITVSDVEIISGESTKVDLALAAPLKGVVTRLSTGDPLPDVMVSADSQTAQTDSEGAYILGGLAPGNYDISFSKENYQTIIINNVDIIEGQTTELNIEMTVPSLLNIVTEQLPASESSVEYNADVRISGGNHPYIYSVAYGALPFGLSLNSSDGTITGIPTTPGSYTFSIVVTDAMDASASRIFTIEVTELFDIITPSLLDRGVLDSDYFLSFEAIGGTPPRCFTLIEGSLPDGLTLASNGNLSGTPSKTGAYDFKLSISDLSGREAEKSFYLQILDPLVILTQRLNDGISNESYYQSLSVSGGYEPYKWGVYSGTLPGGLSLNASTGLISGTPTENSYNTIIVSVEDDDKRISYEAFSLQVVDPIEITNLILPVGFENESYSEAIYVAGGIGPFSFIHAGELPEGLYLNTETGVISGIPTNGGYNNFNITVTDSTYPSVQSTTKYLGIRITSQLTIITSAVLKSAKKDMEITPFIIQAGGGSSPYTWSASAGNLPFGIIVDPSTGGLSGIAYEKGDFIFSIQVIDSDNNKAEKEFFWHISDPLVLLTDNMPDGARGIAYNFVFEAEGGLLPYTWRIKNGMLPDGLLLDNLTGVINGTPTSREIFSFTVEVNDNDSPAQTQEANYTIEISDGLFINTTTLPNGRINDPYNAELKASLGSPPYTWELKEGDLPPGFILNNASTGNNINGIPTSAGTYNFILEVSDTEGLIKKSQEYTIEIYTHVNIETISLKYAVRGQAYHDILTASGGKSPYQWEITQGSLPLGLDLNINTGEISGIPELIISQSTSFKIKAKDSGIPNAFDESELAVYVVDPLEILTESLPDFTQKEKVLTEVEATGGVSPYLWTRLDGELPQGVVLNIHNGVISGTALSCGNFDFTVKIEDSASEPNSLSSVYQLRVACTNYYDISGSVSELENISVILQGNASASTTTDSSGNYKFENLPNGNYTVSASKTGYWIEPDFHDVTINYLDVNNVDFTGIQNQSPATPSNPQPASGTTSAPLNVDLSWTCEDPDGQNTLTYDIYFGSSLELSQVSAEYSGNTYSVADLTSNIVYYWKIVAKDSQGVETEGPIWTFTTLNRKPYEPSNPVPEDGNNNVALDAILSWEGGDPDTTDTVVYNVYFSAYTETNRSGEYKFLKLISGQSERVYTPSELDFGTIYYWKIISRDNHGTEIEGPLWHFRTTIIKGDMNANGAIDLGDAIVVLQALCGIDCNIHQAAAINDDEKPEMRDAIYILEYLGAMLN